MCTQACPLTGLSSPHKHMYSFSFCSVQLRHAGTKSTNIQINYGMSQDSVGKAFGEY